MSHRVSLSMLTFKSISLSRALAMNRSKVSKLKTNIDCGKKIAFVFILRDGGNNASKHIKVNVYKHQISVPLFTDIAST